MASKAKIAKAKRQEKLIQHYAKKRQELKQKGDYLALAKLPRAAHPNRLRHRDVIDGRARGYLRKFGMSRLHFRQLAHQGLIPGIKKASW